MPANIPVRANAAEIVRVAAESEYGRFESKPACDAVPTRPQGCAEAQTGCPYQRGQSPQVSIADEALRAQSGAKFQLLGLHTPSALTVPEIHLGSLRGP